MLWNVKNLAKKKQNKADKMFAEIKEKRKNNKKRKSLVRGLRCSKIWHQILLPLLKLLRIIGKQNIRIVADKHINTKRPVIYYASGNANINELTDELRNILATLKWDIWEMQPLQKRRNLSANIGEQFRKKVLDEADGKYTFQMIQNERYHDKSVAAKEEVFAFLDKIKIRKENIFLYKRK